MAQEVAIISKKWNWWIAAIYFFFFFSFYMYKVYLEYQLLISL